MEEIKSGQFATLSQNALISSIRDELGLEESNANFSFKRWSNEAVRHLDALSIFKQCQAAIPVQNGIACLPNGLYRLLAVVIGDGCHPSNAIYVDTPFLQLCGCDTTAQENVSNFTRSFEIQDGNLIFHSFFDNITEIRIAYLGMNTDEDGLMKIYTDMERAIVAYCCWKYTRKNFKEYPQYIQSNFKNEWIAQKKFVRSIAFQTNYQETRRQILEFMNSIISDKIFAP